jgi:hypothetical protein
MDFVKILTKSASSIAGFDTPVSLVDLLFGTGSSTWCRRENDASASGNRMGDRSKQLNRAVLSLLIFDRNASLNLYS